MIPIGRSAVEMTQYVPRRLASQANGSSSTVAGTPSSHNAEGTNESQPGANETDTPPQSGPTESAAPQAGSSVTSPPATGGPRPILF
jgi:hypothetical protein